ncbi:MAG: hypothetical protein ACREOU_02535 [Candidatus Eiseniibacteriota bacterium]
MRSLAFVLLSIGLVLVPRSAPAHPIVPLPAFTANPYDAARIGLWLTRAMFDGLDGISELVRGYWESAKRHNPPPRPPMIAPVPVGPAAGPAIEPARSPGHGDPAPGSPASGSCNAPEQE